MKINFWLILLLFTALTAAWGAPAVQEPQINAVSAILIDADSGKVLFEKNADTPIPPASMTKLMTIHTALEFINDGKADAVDLVPITANADFRNQPAHSSLMFLEEGQRVSLIELLQGLALPSGNDAGAAVAEYLAGSVDAYVELMNQKAAELGMIQTHFDDSSGYSEKNMTTAREYAEFCRIYIEKNKRFLKQLHQPASFTYPKDKNLPPAGSSVHGPIKQPNHNLLIGRMAGVDGLKTGYIDESGYNFAVTAEMGMRRLILVTMAGPGNSPYDGSLKRAVDAAVLLSYGFYAWSEFTPEVPIDKRVPVYGGTSDSLKIAYSPAAKMLIKNTMLDELKFETEIREINLPVSDGNLLGRWHLMMGDKEIQSGIITASESIKKGNIIQRIFNREP